jgi:hypothetical protein
MKNKLKKSWLLLKQKIRLLRNYMKFCFGRNWWAARHMLHIGNDDAWFAWQVRSVFGIPLTTMFFQVAGPFHTIEEVMEWITERQISKS